MAERSILVTGSKVTNEQLLAAYGPWVNHDVPEAKMIGDVIVAMRSAETKTDEQAVITGLPPKTDSAEDQ